jgi:capsid protein
VPREPLQLQIVETDLLDASRNGDLADGGRILQGVEFDAIGRRRAYWLFAQHPGDNAVSLRRRIESVAMSASDVAHIYE